MVRNIVGSSRHLGLAPCGMRVYSVAKSCPTLCNPKDSSPWSIDQAPLSMEFSRQEYWSRFAIFLLQVIFLTRDWTRMSCTGRQILYHWATREACRRRIRCLVHPKRLGAEGRDWVSPTSKGIIYFSLSEGKVEEMEVRGRGAESKVEFIWILTRVFPLWIKKLDISGKPGEALSGSSWVQSWEKGGKGPYLWNCLFVWERTLSSRYRSHVPTSFRSLHYLISRQLKKRFPRPQSHWLHMCILFLLLVETLRLEWAVGSCFIGRVFEVLFKL